MSTDQIVARLCEVFDKTRVKVHSEFHLGVMALNNRGKHELWNSKREGLKYRLAGSRTTEWARTLNHFIEAVQRVDQGQQLSERDQADRALNLATMISEAQRAMPSDIGRAVFVDAGWKNGIAQIGYVSVRRVDDGFEVDASSWPKRCSSIQEAERTAIVYGGDFDPKAVIFSDCKSLVDQMATEYKGRLVWLPRHQNKAADKIANRRGK